MGFDGDGLFIKPSGKSNWLRAYRRGSFIVTEEAAIRWDREKCVLTFVVDADNRWLL
jgi:hypothetical protein